ncbi:hypothetical protein [Mesorhizobium sp. SP-1A]|uniref:hypothetical protein n=1 Tax=Mesorhizobium sp. SP-1A TaxID=3077840 RepID=UPI0028F74ECC|nr:hypothetical protein [Mesorhizobium sp. SP-1A]
MHRLEQEASAFRTEKQEWAAHSRQIAAASLSCGIDLDRALDTTAEQREHLIRRVERVIERERLKGMRRHWSYDLNRHIALKQFLDRLRGTGCSAGGKTTSRRHAQAQERQQKHKRRPEAPSNVGP